MVTETTPALPGNPLGCRLWELFGHYPWSWIAKSSEAKHWVTEKRHPLHPRLFWSLWNDRNTQIGVRFGHTTDYALIDLDVGSTYLNEPSISEIEAAIETIGLVRTVKIRSSWSGGIHLLIPLPEPVNTFDLAIALKKTLEAHGFQINPGQLEVFPNVKKFGRYWLGEFVDYLGHRLPLQPGSGSVLLNHALRPVGDKLELFFSYWECAQRLQDRELLTEALKVAYKSRKRHKRIQTTYEQWRENLENEIAEGWTAHGQTNHLLKQIGCYGRVFLGLDLTDLGIYMEEQARRLPGFNQWCRHVHEITRRCLGWARSIVGYYYPGTDRPKQQPEPVNKNKQLQSHKERLIFRAMLELCLEPGFDGWNITKLMKAIQVKTGISTRTLYKHKLLWHPSCRNDRPDYHTARIWTGRDPEPDPDPDLPDPPLINGFLHQEGVMKHLAPEFSIRKTYSPGVIGGCGGKEGISTGREPP